MPTSMYEIDYAYDIDNNKIEISPLKLKYYKRFMDKYLTLKTIDSEDVVIDVLSECVCIAMQQYRPNTYENAEDIQNNFDIHNIHKVIDMGIGKKKTSNSEGELEKLDSNNNSWENLDLISLELEVFLTGIWKNIDELEESISMPELFGILNAKRTQDYDEKKFLAAMQGVDLDKESGKSKGQKEWEDMKARVFSKGKATDSNDVLSLQGVNAQKAGFGIGMGLDYEDLR
jgi:hypothetical protein